MIRRKNNGQRPAVKSKPMGASQDPESVAYVDKQRVASREARVRARNETRDRT